MGKILKRTGLLIGAPFLIILVYLFAALLGGVIPAGFKHAEANGILLEKPIYLTANALHADIAIPVNSLSSQQFAFLREAGFPLDNPDLEYLVIGWGAREFYTATGEYSDIRFYTAWRATTGDASVMHVAPAGDLRDADHAIPVRVSEKGFSRMVEFMLDSFTKTNGKRQLIEGATFGYGDVFYEGVGRFNIFTPCNIWVSNALDKAGLASGIWTPTTYSLLLNHKLYN